MNEDEFNLSIRKFLKKVGITAQREIENTVRAALGDGKLDENGSVKVCVRLQIDHLQEDIVIDGQIELS